jgi:pentatricopeptide repeat protein
MIDSAKLHSWTTMLGGYAMHGQGKEALRHFEQMCEKGVEIDKITFVSLLSTCSHADLVDEGLHYFESLHLVYGISATVEQYVCIIDLLVQAGCLEEADDLINMMFCAPHAVVWMALLCACSMHGNVEMGEHIAKQVVELDEGNWTSLATCCYQTYTLLLASGITMSNDRSWKEV